MFELIIKTILAHLIGDFVLQSDKSIKELKSKKFKSKYLYIHYGIHFLLLWCLTGVFLPSLILSTVHIIIDIITKFYLDFPQYKIQIFLIDQALHFLSIGVFIYYFHPYSMPWNEIFNVTNYTTLMALVALTYVSSVVIKIFMSKYVLKNNQELGTENAGKIIGMLERLFIFGFIIIDFWEGIGFLLAAKSIFRFGDLKENKDIKLTEYILIGTLLSFGLAILIALVYLKLLHVT